MKDKIIKIIKNNISWIIGLVCIILFAVILENVLDNDIANFDSYIFNSIKNIRTEVLTRILNTITQFGDAVILITISLLSLIILKNKKIGIMVSLNLATIAGLNKILKHIIQRPRPIGDRLIEEGGYSFPSGHSMASMAFYGLIIYLIFKKVKNKKLKNILIILLSVLISTIGISRIYLGVHYASDVIAGFLFSIAYLILFTSIVKKSERLPKKLIK